MISYYGYSDASGEYYIAIDSNKCNACQKCVTQCPQNALQIIPMFIDLDDKPVVTVKENQCNKIRYICTQQCNPEKNQTKCTTTCPTQAITCHFTQTTTSTSSTFN
ncbi:MAG: 4Fe-4S binding protein [Nitrososphaerota archaeon]|uniref:4Fe-4S binding protein n=1 Tax=Candidatus Bathycorpusculum sp. TaxID=2994959 RepID=UPI0028206BB7|nr:4Fe-4S binding protein [Candidatus Termiticorpusculum sp.]MCL2292014.1 4Fe-4S binding protein [Candidatus Termiticorpusculum sp.]MDR0460599.1 4Fe-4S binding protein [Nitrososphaerota archaeon]